MKKVQFIVGRSGAGKTTYCYEAIETALKEESFDPLLLLVPEQFNLQTQKDLAKRLYPGLLRAEVISFNTLAREVFKEVGKAEVAVIEDLERMIILKRVIEAHKKEIIFYKKNMNNTGFIEAINRFITVLEQAGVSKEQLGELIENKEATLLFKSKLTDIHMLYEAFEDYLGNQFVTIEKNMTLLASSIMKSKKLEKAWLWIDGFYGFTYNQLLIIKELMKKVKGLTITLPMDKPYTRTDKVRNSYPFYESIQMLQKLMGICEEQHLAYEVNYVKGAGEKNEALAYLEGQYLKPYANPYEKGNEAIYLQTYGSRAEEVEQVAKQIVTLVMEEGYRYHDMAVIVGDLADYKTLLEGAFKEYEIPYFLDMKRNIHTNSLVAALEGVLEVLTSNYSYKSIMGLLRTQILPISIEEIDLLENYLLAYGIKGKKKWAQPWGFDQKDEEKQERINITREAILGPIQKLEMTIQMTKSSGKNKVVDLTKALYGFLEDIGAYSKLNEIIAKHKAEGNRLLEIENTQIWGKIMEVFERLVDILGEEELNLMTYRRILETSFSYVKMGVIPPAQDQVLIGSVDRTRLPRLKACFILGTNEGVIPKVDETTPIFSDMDKASLSQMCKEDKGPKGRLNELIIDQPLYGGQFSIYSMLTRATEKLFVSAAMADENGKPLRTSLVYYKLKKLFGETPKPLQGDFLSQIYRPLPTFGYVGNLLREYVEGRLEEEAWKDLVSWYATKDEWKDRLKGLTDYLFYTNQQHYLQEETTHLLYGNKLDTSISKLETFRQCACCYFMRYGIKAEERRLFRFDRAKVGTLFHAALEQYPKELSLMNTTWTKATREEMQQGVKKATAYAVEQVNEAQRETGRFQFTAAKVEKMTSRAIHALTAHLKNGEFEPMGYEINFGEGKGFPPIEIAIDEVRTILVTGQIDRVDVYYKDDNQQYIKILDYKSGQKNFNLLEVYYGLQLQLLLYLDAYLKKHHSYEAGGVFYFHINNPYVSYKVGMDEVQLQESSLKQFKLSGLALDEPEIIAALDKSGTGSTIPVSLNKDGSIKKGSSVATPEQFKLLENHIIDTIRGLGQELLEGKVSAKPYRLKGKNPCEYCIYHTICQFSEEQVDNCYDTLEQLSKEEIWEKLEKEGL
ncbi:exodeoxyribonuclease V subunit gamma [Cellulosilyticum sp. ST5]|uniref:PD-(D/E)XK nuclease family protein n=1 Tax=Cellulosilyticum sp. ST5 TaxID=3055805 RepID=UPI0039775EF4